MGELELNQDTAPEERTVDLLRPGQVGRRTTMTMTVTTDRTAAWPPALDPGDAHDKGELTLCVGEAV
jgi:hypothetical protein